MLPRCARVRKRPASAGRGARGPHALAGDPCTANDRAAGTRERIAARRACPAIAAAARSPSVSTQPPRWAVLSGAGLIAAVLVFAWLGIADPLQARAAALAGVCLVLWLLELVPPHVPTLLLWALVPLALGGLGPHFGLAEVLRGAADPVLALFFGGLALGAAASRHGLDVGLARAALRTARGRRLALVACAMAVTAALSMWMSNIAAAAMMLAALRPLSAGLPAADPLRRALLLAVALGADFGGMATPIGTGPNAIALGHLAQRGVPISFAGWMAIGLPLTLIALALSLGLLAWRYRLAGRVDLPDLPAPPPSAGARWVVAIFVLTAALWLTEPLHGLGAAAVALLAAAALFAAGLLGKDDLGRIDWSTLILIAGGLTLGLLLERSGLVSAAAAALPWSELSALGRAAALCLASALLSALMSNTATATMLIPLASGLGEPPAAAVMIAMAASMGVPFVISTPPNAMAYGEGGLRSSDLLIPGLLLMLGGCLAIAATGPAILGAAGIR